MGIESDDQWQERGLIKVSFNKNLQKIVIISQKLVRLLLNITTASQFKTHTYGTYCFHVTVHKVDNH
jgi:hypothetical protein